MKITIKKIILLLLLILIIGVVMIGIHFTTINEQEKNIKKIDTNKKAEKIITFKDDYFMTQVNDIYNNPNDYIGKKIEIEGFPMDTGDGYKYVGRYGPGCCGNDGYVYLEYVYNEKKISLVAEKDWIKVKGTIKKIVDKTGTIIYIEATSVEKLYTRGIDRVTK